VVIISFNTLITLVRCALTLALCIIIYCHLLPLSTVLSYRVISCGYANSNVEFRLLPPLKYLIIHMLNICTVVTLETTFCTRNMIFLYLFAFLFLYVSKQNNITVFCLSVELLHLEEDEDECLVGWHYYLFSNWYSVYPRRLGSTLIPIWGPCILANKSATVKQNSLWLSWHCATKKFSLYHKKINWTIWFGLVVLSYFQNIKAVLKQYMINVSACV